MTTEQSMKREHITLRLERELRERIEMAAAADRRPVSNLVRNILSDWIDGRQSAERVASN
jgi:uncharacterized protein (DUF1778 family)